MENKYKKILYFLSFILVFYVGVVLLLKLIFVNQIANVINVLFNIGIGFVFLITSVNAYLYIRTKRSRVYTLLYVIGVLLLSICFILIVF